MIIKRYNSAKKDTEVLHQYNVLHVDSSEFSRYAIGSLLVRYDFIVKNFYSVKNTSEVEDALKTQEIDLLLLNYAGSRFDTIQELRRIKKKFPDLILVIYNFAHSQFEKLQLLKSGVNAIFDPDHAFEELLFALQEIRSGSVYYNNLVDEKLVKAVKAHLLESAKDLESEEVTLIREICKGFADHQLMEKHPWTRAKLDQHMHHLAQKTGCESRIDFLRYGMWNKIIKTDEKLLMEVASNS
jgi:DNA-binding NarL/FixJ family response regulator